MRSSPFTLFSRTLWLFLAWCCSSTVYGSNSDGAQDLGVDYAFMFLMTLSPDFAAANYTVRNDNDTDVDITIGRLPYHMDLLKTKTQKLQLELALAYQRTEQVVPTFPLPGENIDAHWNTYGVSAGLTYEKSLTDHLHVIPSLRAGVANMESHATYNGTLTNFIKDQFEGSLFNWQTNASVINLGLGLSYDWTLLDRASSIKADIYHVFVDSFHESNAAVNFSERANMLAVKADMIFPSDIHIDDNRLDYVLLMGSNTFFGENRRTLGYTTSYQFGIGSEFPLRWQQSQRGHLRLSGQVLWADNMRGWLLTVGFNPD